MEYRPIRGRLNVLQGDANDTAKLFAAHAGSDCIRGEVGGEPEGLNGPDTRES